MSEEYRERMVGMIQSRVGREYQASNLGRSFEIEDAEGRIEFAEWYLDVAEKLGLVVVER